MNLDPHFDQVSANRVVDMKTYFVSFLLYLKYTYLPGFCAETSPLPQGDDLLAEVHMLGVCTVKRNTGLACFPYI